MIKLKNSTKKKISNCFDKTQLEHREYYLGWLKSQFGPDDILIVMEEAAVAAGKKFIEGKMNENSK